MKLILLLAFLLTSQQVRGERFYKFVSSTNLVAKCYASPENERGPFGIVLREKNKTHDFLVMTGVYYDICKDLEKRVNVLRKHNKHLLLIGTEGYEENSNSRVWRWRSVRTVNGDKCISYFVHDCPEEKY